MNLKKSLFALAIVSLMTISCKKENTNQEVTSENAAEVEDVILAENLETASFTIEGMSCQVMCASKIQKELAALSGVKEANVDFENKSASVQYDSSKISPEKLVETVEAVGGGDLYKVSNVSSTADQAMVFYKEKEKKKERKNKKKNKEDKSSVNAEDAPKAKPGCCSSKKSCSKSEGQKPNSI